MAFGVGETFGSYSEFQENIKVFQQENNVLFVKKTSKKLPPFHPGADRLIYQYAHFECKQGKKRATVSKGIRPNQRTLKMDCKAYLRVTSIEKNGEWKLRVTGANHTHENHPVDKAITSVLYPENRAPKVTETVKTLAETNVSTGQFRQYVQSSQGKNMLPKDVDNLRAKLTKNDKSDNECVKDILQRVKEEGGVCKFGISENGDFEYLFFVTERMRRDLHMYSDVLVMDATYKVNRYLYPLVNVLCVDSEGQGRPVLHGFVKNENFSVYSCCLRFLKSVMSCDPVVFFVDKDLAENAAIDEIFPDALVKLCGFHASTAVKRALLGHGLSSQLVDALLQNFKEQRDTRSQERFHELCNSVRRDAPDKTVEYFERHWWSIVEKWASHTALDVQTLHLTTTNHVECYHSKIKRTLHAQSRLSDCIKLLLTYDFDLVMTKEMRSVISSNVYHYNVKHGDINLDYFTNTLTSFGSKMVSEQYVIAEKISYTHTSTPSTSTQTSETFHITAPTLHSHSYHTTVTNCNCDFFSRFHLPCRHIFSLRRFLGLSLYSHEMFVSSRFLRQGRLTHDDTDTPQTQDRQETDILPVRRMTGTQEGRYHLVSVVSNRINCIYQVMGEDQFIQRFGQLERFLELVADDREFAILDTTVHTNIPDSSPDTTAQRPDFSPDAPPQLPDFSPDAPIDLPDFSPDRPADIPDATPGIPDVPADLPDATPGIPDVPADLPDATPDIPDAPTDIPDAPTDIPDAPTDIPDAPTDIPDAPTDIPDAPTDIPDAPTDTDLHCFSSVKLLKVKVRGRPSKKQAFTQSSKRRKLCNIDVLFYLKMIVPDDPFAISVFNSSIKIDRCSIRDIEDVDDRIVSCSGSEEQLRTYFTDDAWLIFLNIILTKRIRLES